MKIVEVEGDILVSPAEYIVHQCNCTTHGYAGKGLAKIIFDKYPYSDIYTERTEKEDVSKLGTIMVRGNGHDKRHVINMIAQYHPGKPRSYDPFDTAERREEWFQKCLDEIGKIPMKTIAFPYKIGCNLAGGNWVKYKAMIEKFALEHPEIIVCIVRLPKSGN